MFNTSNKHRFPNLYVNTVQSQTLHLLYNSSNQLLTVPTFSSFNLFMFTEEYGTTINNERRKKIR